jgi:hypothetical protein
MTHPYTLYIFEGDNVDEPPPESLQRPSTIVLGPHVDPDLPYPYYDASLIDFGPYVHHSDVPDSDVPDSDASLFVKGWDDFLRRFPDAPQ